LLYNLKHPHALITDSSKYLQHGFPRQMPGELCVQYVSNIYKYYIAYRLIMDKLEMKAKVKKQ
jgi:hypothetical protein